MFQNRRYIDSGCGCLRIVSSFLVLSNSSISFVVQSLNPKPTHTHTCVNDRMNGECINGLYFSGWREFDISFPDDRSSRLLKTGCHLNVLTDNADSTNPTLDVNVTCTLQLKIIYLQKVAKYLSWFHLVSNPDFWLWLREFTALQNTSALPWKTPRFIGLSIIY